MAEEREKGSGEKLTFTETRAKFVRQTLFVGES